jgi:hypothetical protein
MSKILKMFKKITLNLKKVPEKNKLFKVSKKDMYYFY